MRNYNTLEDYDDSKLIDKIIDLDEKILEEECKEDIDKEKLFKMRYKQMILGLYLQTDPYYSQLIFK